MKSVEKRDEEFVGILLLVAGKVTAVFPNAGKKVTGTVRGCDAAERLAEEEIHFASQANLLRHLQSSRTHESVVSIGEEIVSEEGIVKEGLKNTVHEACVSEILQTSQSFDATSSSSPFVNRQSVSQIVFLSITPFVFSFCSFSRGVFDHKPMVERGESRGRE